MWPFTRKPKVEDNDIEPVKVSLDEAHHYVQPRGDYAANYAYGTKDYSPQIGVELPPIKDQDAILIHWYRPPDSGHPERWWEDNNEDVLQRGEQERFTTSLGRMQPESKPQAKNPWLESHPLPRVTSQMSPSNYRFERPFGQEVERTFNGVHFSMASNRRTYPVNGMEPMRNFRNTFRLEPVARDAENIDLAETNTPSATPAVYVSPPTQPSSRWGL